MTSGQEIRARALELAITANRYAGLEATDYRIRHDAVVYAAFISVGMDGSEDALNRLADRQVQADVNGPVVLDEVRTQVHALGCARLGGTGFDCTCPREHP